VLSTALHAAEMGARTIAYRWKHDMNPVADGLAERIADLVPHSPIHRTPITALAIARYRALKPRTHYLPIGASVPLGALGHVNSALELAHQIKRGEMPAPARVVLPLGSGGTTAGLLLGFAIAGLKTEVIGARVGPRLVVNRRNVFSLVRRTSRLIEKITGERPPDVDPARFRIAQQVYGGSYGRPLPRGVAAARILHDATGIMLDDTYTVKAWAAALDEAQSAEGPVLFWLTFDASCLKN
ncbi:MAG: pyridoxal-phosphate dependent enzyme, partial [Gemmatimonadaceae bacterium]